MKGRATAMGLNGEIKSFTDIAQKIAAQNMGNSSSELKASLDTIGEAFESFKAQVTEKECCANCIHYHAFIEPFKPYEGENTTAYGICFTDCSNAIFKPSRKNCVEFKSRKTTLHIDEP